MARQNADTAARLASKLTLVWAGLSIGVAFLATPAKFLAASLTLPVALEVGRQTFRVYDRVEFALLALLIGLALASPRRRLWLARLAVPAAIVLIEALWLLPDLDRRVSAIQAGSVQPPSSPLHAIYIAVEALKLVWLLGLGVLADRPEPAGAPFSKAG